MKKIFLTDKPVDDYEIYQSSLFKKALGTPPILPGSMADASRVSAFYAPKVAELLETAICEMDGLSVRQSLGFYAHNPLYTTQVREKALLVINSWAERIEGLGDKVTAEHVIDYIVGTKR